MSRERQVSISQLAKPSFNYSLLAGGAAGCIMGIWEFTSV